MHSILVSAISGVWTTHLLVYCRSYQHKEQINLPQSLRLPRILRMMDAYVDWASDMSQDSKQRRTFGFAFGAIRMYGDNPEVDVLPNGTKGKAKSAVLLNGTKGRGGQPAGACSGTSAGLTASVCALKLHVMKHINAL